MIRKVLKCIRRRLSLHVLPPLGCSVLTTARDEAASDHTSIRSRRAHEPKTRGLNKPSPPSTHRARGPGRSQPASAQTAAPSTGTTRLTAGQAHAWSPRRRRPRVHDAVSRRRPSRPPFGGAGSGRRRTWYLLSSWIPLCWYAPSGVFFVML